MLNDCKLWPYLHIHAFFFSKEAQFNILLKCTAVYLRGIVSRFTRSCLDFLCCSFSCRTEKPPNQQNGEEKEAEEAKVNKDPCQNRKIKNKLPLQFPAAESRGYHSKVWGWNLKSNSLRLLCYPKISLKGFIIYLFGSWWLSLKKKKKRNAEKMQKCYPAHRLKHCATKRKGTHRRIRCNSFLFQVWLNSSAHTLTRTLYRHFSHPATTEGCDRYKLRKDGFCAYVQASTKFYQWAHPATWFLNCVLTIVNHTCLTLKQQ